MMRLVVANLNYSSWSIRAWLGLKLSGAEFKLFDVGLKTKEGWKERILDFSGAGKVPILVDGASSIHESIAILETVHERFPEARLWPEDPLLRARGRAISAEMASSFFEVRNRMPTTLRGRAKERPHGQQLDAEVARLLDIFEASLSTSSGDYLLGDVTIADCMFFPVLVRFRTFQVPLSEKLQAYSDRMFSLECVRELEAIAATTPPIPEYDALLS